MTIFPSKRIRFFFLSCVYFASICNLQELLAQNDGPTLQQMYDSQCNNWSDIYEHIPVLCQLASECESVTEIGVRSVVSTWGILQGLSTSPYYPRHYLGIDIASPPSESLNLAKRLAEQHGINFNFLVENDMRITLEPTDMLFIDSLHTYCHLTYELETFSSAVGKYICMHDTSDPWGNRDDDHYFGNYSEYPASYDREKKGLWPAVEDFLANHPEWSLLERRLNNHGFTILIRNE